MFKKVMAVSCLVIVISLFGFASSLSTNAPPDVQLSFHVTAEFWKDHIANHGMLIEIHFSQNGGYEAIKKISLLGEFGRGKGEIVLKGENASAELLLWDPTTRFLEYFIHLDDDFELKTGSRYTLKFLTTNGLIQSYDFIIEDAERDYPNITSPTLNAHFSTPEEIKVRWTHPEVSRPNDTREGKVIESYLFLLIKRKTEFGSEGEMSRILFPVPSNRYEVTIPRATLLNNSMYRIYVEYTAHFRENPIYSKKVRNYIDFVIGDYQYTRMLNETQGQPKLNKANPEAGYHFPFYTYFNENADTNQPVHIMVLPLITPRPSDDFNYFLRSAEETILGGYSRFNGLNIMFLCPVFPRPEIDAYVPCLDHKTLKLTNPPELIRIDLQLIEMVKIFRKQLEDKGIEVAQKLLFEGYSGSAAFSIRFAYIHPELVEAFSAGHCAGWPVLPIAVYEGKTVPFPLGIGDLYKLTGKEFNIRALKEVKVFLYAGTADDNFHFDNDYLDLAVKILGSEAKDIWPNALRKYYENGLYNVTIRLYSGLNHSTTYPAAIPDVVRFFQSVLTNSPQK